MANDLVPVTPPEPPEPDRALAQQGNVLYILYGFAGCFIVFLVANEIAGRFGRLFALPLFLGGLAAFIYVMFVMPGDSIDAHIAEARRGYTTNKGPLFTGIGTTERPLKGVKIPWDFSGVWQLDAEGRILIPPDPRYDPPGYYPSPRDQDRFELWTGAMWTGRLCDPSDVA